MSDDCRDCKSYKGCNGKEFYTYSEIRFCPYQVIFIIENAEIFESGSWPPNPEISNYAGGGKRRYANEANFVKPIGILAEIEYRRVRTGTSGKLLKAEILAGLELSDESKSALMYIKGWRRKRMSFGKWLRDRKFLQKKYDKNVV